MDEVSSMSTDFGLEVSRVYAANSDDDEEEEEGNGDSSGSDSSSEDSGDEVEALDHDGFLDVMEELERGDAAALAAVDPELLPLEDGGFLLAAAAAAAAGEGGAGAGAGGGGGRFQVKTWGQQQNLALGIRFGMAETQGNRNTMEDRVVVIGDYKFRRRSSCSSVTVPADTVARPKVAFFGVYDGHGGEETAERLRAVLHRRVLDHPLFLLREEGPDGGPGGGGGRVAEAMEEGCLLADTEILDADWQKLCRQQEKFQEKGAQKNLQNATTNFSGSTAIFALVMKPPDSDETTVYVANVGDCRAVLCRGPGGLAEELSEDCKPSRPDETARIEEAGGYIHGGRLNGVLAVSRSFGDINHKAFPPPNHLWVAQQLISKPEITSVAVTPDAEFLVLACDGLWDVLTSQQACNYVRRRLAEHRDVQRAAQDLVKKALDYGSVDNVSCVVCCFHQEDRAAHGKALQKLFGGAVGGGGGGGGSPPAPHSPADS